MGQQKSNQCPCQQACENIRRNIHETRFFYGAGMQISINSTTTFRFSAQRYAGSVGLIDSNYTTVRVGFLRFF